MERRVLTEPVIYEGPDYFGRYSSLEIRPYHRRGWWWDVDGVEVAIYYPILEYRMKRLVLESGNRTLNVFEHVGVLRFLGLDNVIIKCESGWYPYHGRPYELWQLIKPNTKVEGKMEFYNKDCYSTGSHNGGQTFFTQIGSQLDRMVVRVDIDFKGLGEHTVVWDSEQNAAELERYLEAYAPAYGRKPRYLANIARPLGLWIHDKHVSWPHLEEPERWLQNAAEHRVCDLLGAMSLGSYSHLLSGFVHSIKAGHKTDYMALKQWSWKTAHS